MKRREKCRCSSAWDSFLGGYDSPGGQRETMAMGTEPPRREEQQRDSEERQTEGECEAVTEERRGDRGRVKERPRKGLSLCPGLSRRASCRVVVLSSRLCSSLPRLPLCLPLPLLPLLSFLPFLVTRLTIPPVFSSKNTHFARSHSSLSFCRLESIRDRRLQRSLQRTRVQPQRRRRLQARVSAATATTATASAATTTTAAVATLAVASATATAPTAAISAAATTTSSDVQAQ